MKTIRLFKKVLARALAPAVAIAFFSAIQPPAQANVAPRGARPMVAAGWQHSLAVMPNGTVWAWGFNGFGQLGDGTTIRRLTSVQVTGLTDVAAVAAGGWHSLAMMPDGTVWAWGWNFFGQQGDGTTTNRLTPVQVTGLTDVVAVAAGREHSLAVKSNGTVWTWGGNERGQLGDGTTTNRLTPVQVTGLTGVVAVAARIFHSLAVRSDGTVWAWGANHEGQLGDNTTTDRHTPVLVSGLTGVVAVEAGGGHSLALKSNGTVWAWGSNGFGQLGDGTTIRRLIPVQVIGLTGVVAAVEAGGSHSLAMMPDGTVRAWGANDSGQLGDGTTTQQSIPVSVSGLTGVVAVAAEWGHSLAVKSDGTVWVWGANWQGQLGDGTTTHRNTPVQVIGLPEVAGFDSWIAARDVPADRRGTQDDPDGDGVENLAEYAFAGDPAQPNRAILPAVGIETIGDAGHLTLTVNRNPDAAGVAIVVEVSTDLATWVSGTDRTTIISETVTRIVVRDNTPLAGAARRFIRARVVME